MKIDSTTRTGWCWCATRLASDTQPLLIRNALVVEQSLKDEDLIEQAYGSNAFHDGVAAFTRPSLKG